MSVTLELRDIRHRYGETVAIDGVGLTLESGRIQALLGPSGCGKTTLLRILAGLLHPSEGSVWMNGADITQTPTQKRGIVMVYQDQLLFPHMSVRQNVAYGLRAQGVGKSDANARADDALRRVQLDGLGDRRPDALSGGQRQRVALARALCTGPRALLLDEPLSALDAGLRDEMRALILEVQAELGVTTVVVTHDQQEAAALAHSVAVVMNGRIEQNAPPEALYQAPATEGVARFLGATNFIAPGTLDPEHRVTHCIWPQDIEAAPGPGPGCHEAEVLSALFNGTERRVRLRLSAGVELEAALPRFCDAAPGSTLWVRLPPERLVPLGGSE